MSTSTVQRSTDVAPGAYKTSSMKERLVRGTQVASVLRVLRAHRRERPLPELGTWEQDLMSRHVATSTWFSLKVFDSLLQIVHRFVFDGSELAAQNMGRNFARMRIAQSDQGYIAEGNALETLAKFAASWREQFNFAEAHVAPLPTRDGTASARVRISGYPDMSACHGHAIMGFSLELAEAAGARKPQLSIEERPWMHNSVLSYTLSWR
jgi:hypothetical protein